MSSSILSEQSENAGFNLSANPSMGEVIAERLSRRDLTKGLLAVSAFGATASPLALLAAGEARGQGGSAFSFKEIAAGVDERDLVAEGYEAQVLIRWGDPLLPGAPEFDPVAQTAEKQARQFGQYNDYLCFVPMPGAAQPGRHGLLCVNHESVHPDTMHPGLNATSSTEVRDRTTKEHAEVQMAATGGSVVEIRREGGGWSVVKNSRYNRRLHTETPFEITGPAAGDDRMKTSADPTGRRVLGMLGNCAGGLTPWGTWLSGEENIQNFFRGGVAGGHSEADNYRRFGSTGRFVWAKWHQRFDLNKEPNEMNRFGWVVEIDPLDPASVPKKRTALGRFKHEGATAIVSRDGRVAVYTGDDERYEFVYRFVSSGRYDPTNRAANMNLLDSGMLSVARYNSDGTCEWLPLVHGQGPLTAANGFSSQADVLIETRRAAQLLGATRMDRPEDIEPNPKTNKIYVALTYNEQRKKEEVDAANPRADNRFGHILEMSPPDGDHAAAKFKWEVLLLCGDPSKPEVGANFHPTTTKNGWFGMPDNLAIDGLGRLWVGTDGNEPKLTGRGDGIWAVDTEGPMRRLSKHFYRVPAGAESTGPFFTPDDETLFVAVQHPGDDGPSYPAHGRFSSFEDPSTRWPDFKPNMPPRSSVVAITKRGGGKIAV